VELAHVIERPGVVHQDVDRPELVDDPRDGSSDLVSSRDVAPYGERAPPEATDLLGRLLGMNHPARTSSGRQSAPAVGVLRQLRLDEDVGDRDVGAGARERQRVGATESRATRQ
jgi:hypothetical protein